MTVNPYNTLLEQSDIYIAVEFYPWFKFNPMDINNLLCFGV